MGLKKFQEKAINKIIREAKEILEEDRKQEQPLFLKISDNLIMNIARKVVQEKKKTFLIGITGESASGKTVFVDNTIKACLKNKTEGIYTVIRCDDYYKDTSKELKEAGSYEALFKTGFSFDTPDVIDLDLMKEIHFVDDRLKPLLKKNTLFYYSIHPRDFLRDLKESPWKVGFLSYNLGTSRGIASIYIFLKRVKRWLK